MRLYSLADGTMLDLSEITMIGPPKTDHGFHGVFSYIAPAPYYFGFTIQFKGMPEPKKFRTGAVSPDRNFNKTGWWIFKTEIESISFDIDQIRIEEEDNRRIHGELMAAWKAYHNQMEVGS